MEFQGNIQKQLNADKKRINIPPLILPQGKSPGEPYPSSSRTNFFTYQPELPTPAITPKRYADDELKQSVIPPESPRIQKLLETNKNKLAQFHLSNETEQEKNQELKPFIVPQGKSVRENYKTYLNNNFFIPQQISYSKPRVIFDKKIKKEIISILFEHLKLSKNELVTVKLSNKEYNFLIIYNNNSPTFYYLDYSKCLGRGARSNVYLVFELKTGNVAAAKIFKESGPILALKEEKSLKWLNRFMGSVYDKHSLLLMTYFPGKTLTKWLYSTNIKVSRNQIGYFERQGELSPFTKLDIIIATIEAVHSFHKAGLFHRDLKPDNLIVNRDNKGKISVAIVDVTDAIATSENFYHYRGAFGYIPPTPLTKKAYDFEDEYFSLFVIIAEILSNQNYQESLKVIMQKYKSKDYLPELNAEHIKKILFDVFNTQSLVEEEKEEETRNKYDIFVFNLLILPYLQKIISAGIGGIAEPKTKIVLDRIILKLTNLREASKEIVNKFNTLNHLAHEVVELVTRVAQSEYSDSTENISEDSNEYEGCVEDRKSKLYCRPKNKNEI